MESNKETLILLKISSYNIALPLEICRSVNIYQDGDKVKNQIDLSLFALGLNHINFPNFLILKNNYIISFSKFRGIITSDKKYIDIPEDIFYNKLVYFTNLYYHKADDEYYTVLRYSLSQ